MTIESTIILRLATDADIHALHLLIEAFDTQLIADRSYFAAESVDESGL